MAKPIPKSLHTVTVIVKLANFHHGAERCEPETSIAWALKLLGYDAANDPYNLASAARKQMGFDL